MYNTFGPGQRMKIQRITEVHFLYQNSSDYSPREENAYQYFHNLPWTGHCLSNSERIQLFGCSSILGSVCAMYLSFKMHVEITECFLFLCKNLFLECSSYSIHFLIMTILYINNMNHTTAAKGPFEVSYGKGQLRCQKITFF